MKVGHVSRKNFALTFFIAVFIFGFLGLINTSLAWTSPTQTPPNGNGVVSASSGFLGVGGITAPAQSLQIKASADNGVYPLDITLPNGNRRAAFYLANGNGSFYLYDSANATKVLLTSYMNDPSYFNITNGNFGLGTTVPTEKFDVRGTSYFGGNTDIYGHITINNSGGVVKIQPGTVTSPGIQIAGDPNTGVYSPDADRISFVTAGTERISILANGNVGIGTTNPTQPFSAKSGSTVLNFSGSGEFLTNAVFSQLGATSYLGNTITNYSTVDDLKIEPRTNTKNLLLATGTGNVGIGTTAPMGKIDLGTTGDFIFGTTTEKINLSGNYLRLKARGSSVASQEITISRHDDTYDYLKLDTDSIIFTWRKAADINGNTNIYGYYNMSGGTYLNMGGSPIYGNTTASGNLTLHSTSHATKGIVRINPSGGNVGVGTTAPSAAFAVSGSIYTSGGYVFPDGILFTGTGTFGQWSKTGANIYLTNSSDNVGISTTTPNQKLRIDSGNIKLSGGSGFAWKGISGSDSFSSMTNGLFKLYYGNDNDGSLVLNTNASSLTEIYATGASTGLTLGVNSAEKIRISPAGNVGIGSTGPTAELDASGRGRFSQGIQITGNTSFPADTGLVLRSYAGYKEIQSFNSSPIALNPVGNNVGVGTTTPYNTFAVSSAGSDQTLFRSTGTSYGTVNIDVGGTGIPNLQFRQAGVAKAAIGVDAAGKLLFGIPNTSSAKMLIDTNGNVGIGIATPTAQLHIPSKIPTAATGVATTSDKPISLTVQGRYAYVGTEDLSNFQIFDISNPTAPLLMGSTGLGAYDVILSPRVQGSYAYVLNNTDALLYVVNVSNPITPVIVGSVATGASPYDLYVSGKYAYVANYTPKTLQIFDISNPHSPISVGSVATTDNPQTVYVQGRYAYVAGADLQIFDISNPASPVSVGSYATMGSTQTVVVQGRYAYMGSSGSQVLEVLDVANPAAPSSVTWISTGVSTRVYSVQGKYLYAANGTQSTFQIFDISNPASPTSMGTVSTETTPQYVCVQGRYAYIVNFNSDSLQVFDLSGSYIQQLEAGGIETGTLSVRTNAIINNDLDVRGGLQIGGGLAAYGASSFFSTSTDNILSVARKGGTYPTVFKEGTDGAFILNNNNVDVLTLKSGNVGIGTTAPSASYGTLTVAGTGVTISDDGNAKLQLGRYSGAADYSYIKASAASQGFKFSNALDTADLVIIKNAGNVGIGVDPGSYKLNVNGPLNATALWENSSSKPTDNYALRGTWTDLGSYPSACSGYNMATGIGDTLTCGFNAYPVYASETTANQRIQTDTNTNVYVYLDEVRDPQGRWNSDYYYSCPVTGYYQVSAGFMASDVEAGKWAEAIIAVSGSARCVQSKSQYGVGGWEVWQTSCKVYCTSSQSISLMTKSADPDYYIRYEPGIGYAYISIYLAGL
ncbi:MAG: hypothetical protein PHN74_01185 [Candidatus Pacebacteria bacterium]|nr:hypothetical protein [Candidatus Paceibacterota bacterium]